MAAAIDKELDELYAADLDDFVKLRNDLAKRLRKDGDGEAAASVQALRKPSLVAWTANQAVRKAPREAGKLLDAGDRLLSAQKELIKGGRAGTLDDSRLAHEEMVGRLVGVGARSLEQQGRPATRSTLDRLAVTLRAASVREDVRDRLKQARLDEEVEPVGFEALAGLSGQRSTPRRGGAVRKPGRKQIETLLASVKRARERERKLEAEAGEAAREAEKARRQASRLEDKAAAAARKAEEASAARAEAERQLEAARRA